MATNSGNVLTVTAGQWGTQNPGQGGANLNGNTVTVKTTISGLTQTLAGQGWSFTLTTTSNQVPTLTAGGVLQAISSKQLQVAGTGLAPNTQLKIWLTLTTTSQATLLGTFTTDNTGNVTATVNLPPTPGAASVQIDAYITGTATTSLRASATSLGVLSANLGLVIQAGTATTQPAGKASKLTITSWPKCAKQYKFTVQRQQTKTVQRGSDEPTTQITWKQIGGTHQTKGRTQTSTINLPKGTYRAVVKAACRQAQITTNETTLTR